MNKKVIQAQKEKNVINSFIIFTLFILIPFYSFSQREILGKYVINYKLKDVGTRYEFKTNGIFILENYGDLGVESYGKGHYLIKNDSLILDYDLTELKRNSYHIYKYYKNNNDSIQIKINLFNFHRKELQNISVLGDLKGNYGVLSDQNGLAYLRFMKQQGQKKVDISNICCGNYSFYINTEFNYEVDVFLKERFNNPIAIKNQIEKMVILEFKKDIIKLKTKGRIMTWKKINSN